MKYLTTIALAVVLIAAGAVMAAPAADPTPAPMPGMMPPHPPMMGMMMEADDEGEDNDGPGMMGCMMGLNLTDDQQASLQKAHLEMQKKQLERHAQMVDLMTKLKLAMVADKYSQKDIDDLAAKIGKFHQESVQLKAKHLREVRDVLTPEQRAHFDQMILSGPMMGGGKGMKGMGMMRGMKRGGMCPMGSGRGNDDDDNAPRHRGRGWN